MKKIIVIFLVLLSAFVCTWVVKAQSPLNRPESETGASTYADGIWWQADKDTVSSEWILDPEIPDNYLPVPGREELYMVIDNDGNIIQYRERVLQEDGSWLWDDVNPDIPENYEAVEGLEDVYKVTDENGNISYYKYIRNKDDTFAFVPVDQDGELLEKEATNASEIPDNYRRITGNIYAVLNEHGVVIGYRERRISSDGDYYWVECDEPTIKKNSSTDTGSKKTEAEKNNEPTVSTSTQNQNTQINGGTKTQSNTNGTYTQTETIISTETAGGWVTTYQTTITRVYDERGTLISTKKEEPVVISKVKAGESNTNAPDPSKIAATLNEEYARVSVGLNYKTALANEVLTLINEERKAEGLSPLTMDTSSTAYKLAMTRASDMAIYDHSDFDSPTYGLLSEMMARFNISSGIPSENTWKTTTSKNAGAIHTRFMLLEGSRAALMSPNYTKIGIGIVQKNGYFYICQVLID